MSDPNVFHLPPGLARTDEAGRRYVPEELPVGLLACYLSRRQVELLLAHELHLQAQGQPHGPTGPLAAAFRKIEAEPQWPTLPGEPSITMPPALVPVSPRPGLLAAHLNAGEFATLATSYIQQAEGAPPHVWQMFERARMYAALAGMLDGPQFGHLHDAISPPTEGEA